MNNIRYIDVNPKKWNRGIPLGSLLCDSLCKRCLMGFVLESVGIPPEMFYRCAKVKDAVAEYPGEDWGRLYCNEWLQDTDLELDLVSINDTEVPLRDAYRIERANRILAEHGYSNIQFRLVA